MDHFGVHSLITLLRVKSQPVLLPHVFQKFNGMDLQDMELEGYGDWKGAVCCHKLLDQQLIVWIQGLTEASIFYQYELVEGKDVRLL